MEKNANTPAFSGPNYSGLTKREYFAAMAMQGILSNNNGIGLIENIATTVVNDSIRIADKLLEKLES